MSKEINDIKILFNREQEINNILLKALSTELEHWLSTEDKIQKMKLIWSRDGLCVQSINDKNIFFNFSNIMDTTTDYLNWIELTNSSIEISQYKAILRAIIGISVAEFQKFNFIEYINFEFIFLYDKNEYDNRLSVPLRQEDIKELFIEKKQLIEDLDDEIAAIYKELDLSFLIEQYPEIQSLGFMMSTGFNFKFIGPLVVNRFAFLDVQVFDNGELKFLREEEKTEIFNLNIKEQDLRSLADSLFFYLDSLFIDKRKFCNCTNVSNDFTIKKA